MPVSFKVPKSPTKSKYVIDTFLGVDYTSAGIDVDPSRSPNAPNMVRHTPGKVRKRMGYSNEIQFGPVTNVNYAAGTSLKEQEIRIAESEISNQILLYNLVDLIVAESSSITIYYEFDYKAEHNFSIYPGGNSISASEEWTHYSGTATISSGNQVEEIQILSSQAQDIFIKCFSVMRAKDGNYKWSPAPKKIVEHSGNKICNGCFDYYIPSSAKSYMNMNRVQSASDTFTTFSLTPGHLVIYNLEEGVYKHRYTGEGRRIYFEFDYQLTGSNATIYAAGGNSNVITLAPTTTTKHISASQMAGQYGPFQTEVYAHIDEGTATLKIKNMFIGYAVDDTYEWKTSPEDRGMDKQSSLLYWTGDKNYSTISSHEETRVLPSEDHFEDEFTIIPSTEETHPIRGFFHFSCIVQFTTDQSYYQYSEVYLEHDNHQIKILSGDISTAKKIDYYGSISSYADYPEKVYIIHYFSRNVVGTATSIMTDIEVNEVSPRDIASLSGKYNIFHIGNSVWLSTTDYETQLVYSSAANKKSWAIQFEDKLILLDKNNIYDFKIGKSMTFGPLDPDYCYTPLITIAKSPSGGGSSYEALNMLTPAFIEQFIVTSSESTATQFQLSFSKLDNRTVKAWVLGASGSWSEKTQGTDFNVNRETGVVTFVTAPGTTPISGQDNVRIQAYKTIEGYRDRIAKCSFGTVYGVNGRPDRLFVSGNPDYPAQDFYSEQNDYTYFPDVNYSNIGAANGTITGYAKIGNYLGTFKKENEHENSLILREGIINTYEDGSTESSFVIVNTLQGEGLISPYSIAYLEGEPLFLSKKGIYAITTNDGTEKRYGQNRSYYLNGKLNDEPNLENGHSTVFNNMYILALNNKLYILDGLQPNYTENEPYSTKQYAAFYCEDIPATCIWSDSEDLFFGTDDGKICKFYKEDEDIYSYQDNGYPITAWWETPDLDGYLFYKNKTFRYFAIRLMKAFRTSYKFYAKKFSVWTFIKEDDTTGRTFDFSRLDFSDFTFSTDWSEKISHTKLRVKKVDKASFKMENSKLYQPFGIYDLALEYLENGNYKR